MTKSYESPAHNATKNKNVEHLSSLFEVLSKFYPKSQKAFVNLMKEFLYKGVMVGDHTILSCYREEIMSKMGCKDIIFDRNICRPLRQSGLLETTHMPVNEKYRPMEFKIPIFVMYISFKKRVPFYKSPFMKKSVKISDIVDGNVDSNILNIESDTEYKTTLYNLNAGYTRQRGNITFGTFMIYPSKTKRFRTPEYRREERRRAAEKRFANEKPDVAISSFYSYLMEEWKISHSNILAVFAATSHRVLFEVYYDLKKNPPLLFNGSLLAMACQRVSRKRGKSYGREKYRLERGRSLGRARILRKKESASIPSIAINYKQISKSVRSTVEGQKKTEQKQSEQRFFKDWKAKTSDQKTAYKLLTKYAGKLTHTEKAKIIDDCSLERIKLGIKRCKQYIESKIIDFGAFYYNACKKAALFPKNHVVKPKRGGKMFDKKPMRHVLDATYEFCKLFSMTNSELLYLNQGRLWNLNAFKKSAILYIMTQYRYEKNIKQNHKSIISFLYQKLSELANKQHVAIYKSASETQIEYMKSLEFPENTDENRLEA